MSVLDVRAIREKTGLTRKEFAEKIGCDASTVRNWEDGYNVPRPAFIEKMTALEESMCPGVVVSREKKLLRTFYYARDLLKAEKITTADVLDLVYEYVNYEESEAMLRKWARIGFFKYHDSISLGSIDWGKLPKEYKKALKV